MNTKIFLDWVLVIALVILSKINKWRVSFIRDGATEPLTFLREPHSFLDARFGDEIKLECLTLEEDTQISWYHNRVRVNPGRHPLPNSLVKVEVVNRISILVIRKLIPDLQGRYHCKASNENAAVRKGAWVNGTSESYSNEMNDGGNFSKKSGDPFSLRNMEGDVKKFVWTKSSSENPYKLIFFDEATESGGMNSLNHVNVLPNGSLSIDSLNILDQGDWTLMLVNSGGCVKQTKYRLEMENSEVDVCGSPDRYTQEEDYEHVNTDAGSVGQIVGGKDAENGSAPWYVGLCRKSKVYCGGTLVGRKWVVTAAHCFFDKQQDGYIPIEKDKVSIKVGSHSNCDPNNNYPIKRLITHHKQNIPGDNYNNDIAVLELGVPEGDPVYSDSVKPACLEKSSFYSEENVYKPKSLGRVVGLGKLRWGDKVGAKTLQAVDVPIVAQAVCIAATTYNIAENTTICAGLPEGGKDSCGGDSGGPFTMELQERTFLVGVVSWGIGCAQPGKYGYYVDVGKYYDWIHEQIAPPSPTADDDFDNYNY